MHGLLLGYFIESVLFAYMIFIISLSMIALQLLALVIVM